MKRNNFFIIPLVALIITLSSCASMPASENIENQGPYFKNQQTKEKLLIVDWKYMGFGNNLPQWVIPALENNSDKIKQSDSKLTNSDIIIIKSEGCNLDQAENAIKEQTKPEGYSLYDSFWVKIDSTENNYISISVYYKELSVEEN